MTGFRRVYATEADDAIPHDLNAIKADRVVLVANLQAIADALDGDTLTLADYRTVVDAALTSPTTTEMIRAGYARGTELGGATDLDGKLVYSSRADGVEIAQLNVARTDLAGLNAGLTALLGNLDADATVDSTYSGGVVTMTSNPVVKVDQLAGGEPAQLNAAGYREHCSDADDGLGLEVEAVGANQTSIRLSIIEMLQTLDLDVGVPLDTYEELYTPAKSTGFGVRRSSSAKVAGVTGGVGSIVPAHAPDDHPTG